MRQSRRAKRPVGLGLYGREDEAQAIWRLTITRLSDEAYQPQQFEKAGPPIVPTNVVPTIASTTASTTP